MSTPGRALALLFATGITVALGSGAAWADEPAGTASGTGRSTLEILVFFGGSTVGLFLLVALFALMTARNNYTPPPAGTDLEKAPGSTPVHH